MTDHTMEEKRNHAVLVGLHASSLSQEENASDATLEELEALLETAGGVCVGSVLQNRETPEARTIIGEGKVAGGGPPWSRPKGRTWWSLTTSFPPPSSGSSPKRWGPRSSTGRG